MDERVSGLSDLVKYLYTALNYNNVENAQTVDLPMHFKRALERMSLMNFSQRSQR